MIGVVPTVVGPGSSISSNFWPLGVTLRQFRLDDGVSGSYPGRQPAKK
jgi:hypothetical protein